MLLEAAKYHYHLDIQSANRNRETQQAEIERFIKTPVDAIVVTPFDSNEINSSIAEANAAQIPVFTADIERSGNSTDVVAHVGSDNFAGGKLAGQLMCKAVGKSGEIVIIDEENVTSVSDRVAGFKSELQQRCPLVRVVSVDSDGTGREAMAETLKILQNGPADITGIFGINDDSALGAVDAVARDGLKGKIAIVGYDGMPAARRAIDTGDLFGDVVQDPDAIGATTILTIHTYFTQGKVPRSIVNVPVGVIGGKRGLAKSAPSQTGS